MNASCLPPLPSRPHALDVRASCAGAWRSLAIAVLTWALPGVMVQFQPVHAQEVSIEDALGVTFFSSGNTVGFGGPAEQYLEPAFQIQQADFTHTVVFTGIPQNPYSIYQLQRSFADQDEWSQVFASGLEPDATGVIVFHDSTPSEQMFYRLVIFTDTQRTFTVRNPGATALTDVQVTVDGEESGLFQVNSTELPAVLPPDVSASFGVNYIADDAAERTVELRISSNLAEPFVLILAGGVAPLPPPPPIITRQPQGLSVPSGQSATITIQAVGASLEYQWYAGESGDTSAPIEGATGPAYTTPTLSSAASFWVRVSDANGLATDSQTATVTVESTPASVVLRAIEVRDGKFRFAITGTAGSRWRVLRLTTAFPDWLPLESVGLVELGDEELTLEIPVETAPFAFHQLEQEP